MKKINIILTALALIFGAAACNSLDLEPKGVLADNTMFNSEYGIQKYLAAIYNNLPIEDFNYAYSKSDNSTGYGRGGNRWDALKGYGSTVAGHTTGRIGSAGTGGQFGYWPYDYIRDINVLITKLPEYADNFTEERYNELMAEARFIRAYFYFALAKRYGGVPIVDSVQDPTADIESLQIPRSTEYDTWKFIYEDLKFAMENGSSDRANTSRGNRYVAAALMSKAMLWAGSVAKYNSTTEITGPATEAGLMGMDNTYAAEFFKYAYDACKMISEGGYSLHTGADKEKAYTEVFIENTDEDIFVKSFGEPHTQVLWETALYSSYDALILPKGIAQEEGTNLNATWDIVSLYEVPAVVDENGYPIRFDSLDEFWKGKKAENGDVIIPAMEPRCKANFFFSGMKESLSGEIIDVQAGVYKEYPGTAKDGCPDTNVEDGYAKEHRVRAKSPGSTMKIGAWEGKVNGIHGFADNGNDVGYSTTGILIRKYVNYKADPSKRVLHQSTQSWKVFRYGEILCNWAEAAYELGLETGDEALKQEAFVHINALRDRAGATKHDMVGAPQDVGTDLYGFPLDENLQYIRDERARELCIENQLEWDYRRWRIFHHKFESAYLPKVLFGYYVIDEDKYIFLNERIPIAYSISFNKIHYYEAIPGHEINKNPNLVRNDGY